MDGWVVQRKFYKSFRENVLNIKKQFYLIIRGRLGEKRDDYKKVSIGMGGSKILTVQVCFLLPSSNETFPTTK